MKTIVAVLVLTCSLSQAGWAQTFDIDNCNEDQGVLLVRAHHRTIEMLDRAIAYLNRHASSSVEYTRWFGADPDGARPPYVRYTYETIRSAMAATRVKYACVSRANESCREGALAYVFPNFDNQTMHFCPSFFSHVEGEVSEQNEANSIVIHEMSHFPQLRGTFDHAYGRSDCMRLARTAPQNAIRNADSYRLFVLDII